MHRRTLAAALAGFLAVATATCGPGPGGAEPPPGHDGPIVLITIEGLRADMVAALGGEPGLTPHLDRFMEGADWAGRAVASSSWLAPALVSLFTGLKPWQHQAILPTLATLRPELPSLPRTLARLGYPGTAFHSSHRLDADAGWGRDFTAVEELYRGARAADYLRRLSGGRELVWIHIDSPTLPYLRWGLLRHRLGTAAPAELPPQMGAEELAPYFDPAVALPAEEARQLGALYRLEVAWADLLLGRLLRALRASGQRDRALVAVVSVYGQELGDYGQVAGGGSLGRALIEVPLALDLPAAGGRALTPPGPQPVAAARLWATLVEAAGGPVPPGVAPSLGSTAPFPATSELYLAGDHNEISLVEGDYQLRRIVPYIRADELYYPPRLAAFNGGPRRPLSDVARRAFGRFDHAFRTTLPFSGGAEPVRHVLLRWTAQGGVEVVEEPAREARMAAALAAQWRLFVGGERPPEEEARRWAAAARP